MPVAVFLLGISGPSIISRLNLNPCRTHLVFFYYKNFCLYLLFWWAGRRGEGVDMRTAVPMAAVVIKIAGVIVYFHFLQLLVSLTYVGFSNLGCFFIYNS